MVIFIQKMSCQGVLVAFPLGHEGMWEKKKKRKKTEEKSENFVF